jgi:hypothetical protein
MIVHSGHLSPYERRQTREALEYHQLAKNRATVSQIEMREVLIGRQRERQMIAEAEREAARRRG